MMVDPQQQRTESFKDTIDNTEFKRDQKKLNKKLSTTQKLLTRNQLF